MHVDHKDMAYEGNLHRQVGQDDFNKSVEGEDRRSPNVDPHCHMNTEEYHRGGWQWEHGECSKYTSKRGVRHQDHKASIGGRPRESSHEGWVDHEGIFERRGHVDLNSRRQESKSLDDETAKCQQRRRRQVERETERRQREMQGLAGHYIAVDVNGIPYGFGVGAWRAELNKLTARLDPSILNIKHQPEEEMATLRRRLKDQFEYSAPVDRAHIRTLAGKNITQRRSKLIAAIRAGEPRPASMDDEVWHRLDRISKDPHREELS